ncbi:hypothetical protein [Kocuria sp. CPCC 205263]|uniref:hypothetical protein n=1 Tax=Kocuria sp. CPCC 205263 TaxID=3073555 RepID=UPI0034D5FBF2
MTWAPDRVTDPIPTPGSKLADLLDFDVYVAARWPEDSEPAVRTRFACAVPDEHAPAYLLLNGIGVPGLVGLDQWFDWAYRVLYDDDARMDAPTTQAPDPTDLHPRRIP